MKFLTAVLLLACLTFATAKLAPLKDAQYEFLFSSWAKQHGRVYQSHEFLYRFATWKANLDYIRSHNAKPSKTHTLAMNTFGDMPNEEFREKMTGYTHINNAYFRVKNEKSLNMVDLPTSVDWNAAGKVTPVKDQGQCGSCWSFSSTGSIEANYAILNNCAPISLSEQQLVDCSTAEGNQGCNGGLMDQAFTYVANVSGLCTEDAYPYTAQDGTCGLPGQCTPVVAIKGFTDVTANSEAALQAAVAQQPVSVAVDASGMDWQFYSSGVMSDACGTELDHGVLAAGYGTSSGTPYWLVKNSWGSSWGQSGYVMLKRGSGTGQPGECGIAMAASYPTGAYHL
jgi:cathepsin L